MTEIDKNVTKVLEALIEGKKDKRDNWAGNPKYLPIRELTNDDTGDLGELLLEDVFSSNGHEVQYDKATTGEEKDWDIIIDGLKIEVKTATIGKSGNTFQHENFFKNRTYDAAIFLDFTSKTLYMTICKKSHILWDDLHHRKVNGMYTNTYKFDFGLNQLLNGEIKKLKKSYIKEIKSPKDMLDLFSTFKRAENL